MRVIGLILVCALGSWCVYLPFRSVRPGSITFRRYTWERARHPHMFWLNVITSGVVGLIILAEVIYLSVVIPRK